MGIKIGQAVRLRPGSDIDDRLIEATSLTGIAGDVWTDERGERISVVFETVQIYVYDRPAADFVLDVALADAPF